MEINKNRNLRKMEINKNGNLRKMEINKKVKINKKWKSEQGQSVQGTMRIKKNGN